MKSLFEKLNLGSHTSLLVLNAPESFETELSQLEGVEVLRKATKKPTLGFAMGFAITEAELDQVSSAMVKSTEGDAIVWVAYPKQSSKEYTCEFNRDSGWKVLGEAGFEPVRMVAIDHNWTALRFRRTEFIKSLTRNNAMAISQEGKRRTKK